jgi:hypothetical protein
VPEILGKTDTLAARAYNENGQIKVLVVNASREAANANLTVGGKPIALRLASLESKWLNLK